MKVLSFRVLVVVATAVGAGALGVVAACGSSSDAPVSGFGDDASGGGSSSGASSGSSGSGSSGGSSSGGNLDGGLVVYDGPPPSIADGAVSCSSAGGVNIRFNPMYSGYDGVHTYQVPAVVMGVDPSTVTWGASDPTMVSFSPYVRGIMITTKKAGTVTITATVTSGGTTTCGSAPLTITAYTTAEWQLGHDRYNNGQGLTVFSLLQQLDASIPDGGLDGSFDGSFDAGDSGNCPNLPANFTNPFDNPPSACTNCHGDVNNGQLFGITLFSDVSHTPEQTGGYSESQLTDLFMHGLVPDGGYFDESIICYKDWHLAHQWTDINTSEGQKGMNAYLRSLTPAQQLGCFASTPRATGAETDGDDADPGCERTPRGQALASRHRPRGPMRYSACIEWLFAAEHAAPADRIRAAKEAGLDGVEFWGFSDKDLPAIRQALKETGLTLAGILCEPAAPLANPDSHARFLEGVRTSMAAALQLGARTIIAQAGDRRRLVGRSAQHASIVKVLKDAARILQGSGVVLALEPLNDRVDHPRSYLTSTTEGLDIVDEVNRPEVRLLYDIYHAAVMGEAIDLLQGRLDRVAHVHLADTPGRGEPGTGRMDCAERLAWLSRQGYAGLVGLEYKPGRATVETLRFRDLVSA
jgi:hydroxypyruvate isomerase